MAEKKYADHLALEVNVPTLIKPWSVRGAKSPKTGETFYMLGVKEGGRDLEVPWLHLSHMEELVGLKVASRGQWPDGNPKFTIVNNAPEVVVCKRQPAGEKYPHLEFALATEDSGPEMPTRSPSPAPNPEAVTADYVTLAVSETKRLLLGLGVENLEDPLIAQAAIECAQKLYVTFRIEGQR